MFIILLMLVLPYVFFFFFLPQEGTIDIADIICIVDQGPMLRDDLRVYQTVWFDCPLDPSWIVPYPTKQVNEKKLSEIYQQKKNKKKALFSQLNLFQNNLCHRCFC